MNRIFLATHGRMASGMKSSLDLLIGKTRHITTFDAYVDARNLDQEIERFYADCAENDVALLISDLYGGSVNNLLTAYVGRKNTFLISGFNLAFLLELCVNPEHNVTQEKLAALIEESKTMFRLISPADLETQFPESDLFEEQEVIL